MRRNVWVLAFIMGVLLCLFAAILSLTVDANHNPSVRMAPPDTMVSLETFLLPTTTTLEEITAPAVVLEKAVRLEPPPSTTTTVPSPYAPEGLSGCAEADWYTADAGLPFDAVPGAGESGAGGFDSQPQSGVPFASYGIAFREASCDNSAHTSCCYGYFQIHIGNRTAPGYRDGFIRCGVFSKWDFWGDLPQQKKANACVAKVLYDVWVAGGSDWPWVL